MSISLVQILTVKKNVSVTRWCKIGLVDLDSKLKLFRDTLDSLQRAAKTIESSKYGTNMESVALKPMRQNIEDSKKTLHDLFTCQGKYQRPKDSSTLKLVVDHWIFDYNGRDIVESAIREIGDRVESIKMIVNEINTYVCNSARYY